jgi:hypothetical protein
VLPEPWILETFPFITTIGNAQFLDVFCIFEYQENKQFFRFLSIDSRELPFRDDAVRPLCKDNNLFLAILWKSRGSGINIVLDKSDRLTPFIIILVVLSQIYTSNF